MSAQLGATMHRMPLPLLAACALLWPITHAGPIAEYLSDAGLAKHGATFEKALADSEWSGHDLDKLQAMEAYELGELCSEAEMTTKEAIKLSRALRGRAAGGAESQRPEFGSSLAADGGAPKPKRRPPSPPEPRVHRELLRHQRTVALAPSLPRIHVDEIDVNPDFETYRRRERPFILVGATESWKAMEKWKTLSYLGDMMPKEVTDFYPHNMLSMDRQNPYLTRLGRAVQQLLNPQDYSKFNYDPTAMEGRYMHLQLTPPKWRELEAAGDIDTERHWHLKGDEWMDVCIPEPDLQSEYHLKTHWQIILAGSRGAGMFNHSDSLETSSWHATVLGTKWWYVCKGECFESYVEVRLCHFFPSFCHCPHHFCHFFHHCFHYLSLLPSFSLRRSVRFCTTARGGATRRRTS